MKRVILLAIVLLQGLIGIAQDFWRDTLVLRHPDQSINILAEDSIFSGEVRAMRDFMEIVASPLTKDDIYKVVKILDDISLNEDILMSAQELVKNPKIELVWLRSVLGLDFLYLIVKGEVVTVNIRSLDDEMGELVYDWALTASYNKIGINDNKPWGYNTKTKRFISVLNIYSSYVEKGNHETNPLVVISRVPYPSKVYRYLINSYGVENELTFDDVERLRRELFNKFSLFTVPFTI